MPSQPQPARSAPVLHRRLGEQLDLFHFPDHSPGMVSWHPRGLVVYRALEALVRALNERHGYVEVRSPLVCAAGLWERSGHAAKFADKMFGLEVDGAPAALKPMNCPGHAELFAHRPRSYRELPLRLAELGHVHRAEQSGEVNGLLGRARSSSTTRTCSAAPARRTRSCAPAWAWRARCTSSSACARTPSSPCVPRSGSAPTRCGTAPRALCAPPSPRPVWRSTSARARARSTARRSTCTCRTVTGAPGSWARCSSTTSSPGGSRSRTSTRRDGARSRSSCTAHCSAASSGSWRSCSSTSTALLPLWLAAEAVRVLPVGDAQRAYAEKVAAAVRAAGARADVEAGGPLGGRIRAAHAARVPLVAVVCDR
jgi:threonyl-tRNA synthetase